MLNGISASVMLAQAIQPGTPLALAILNWLKSLSSLMVLVAGLMILGGACILVITKRRPAVLAAYLVLLPLPVLFAIFGQLWGMFNSFSVIAASPGISLPTEDIAGGIAGSLVEMLFAMLISAPTYFVLAYGLLIRTLNLPTDPTQPTSARSALREPLPSSGGPMPVTT